MNRREPASGADVSRRRDRAGLIAWAASALYALYYFLLGFRPGVLRSDDFGYLRSIIGTLRRGHPYTYDWLAPYGAVLSSACASLYRLTGDFYLSTYGFQTLCVLAAFALLRRLLAARLAPGPAALLALAFATAPVWFAKAADFHGSMSTMALFLAALICHETGRIPGFFLAAFLAFANRQSQLALLILPAWSAASGILRRGEKRGEKSDGSLPWVLAFFAGAIGLHLGMNRTYAMDHAVFASTGGGRILSVTLAWAAGFAAAAALLALSGSLFRSPWATLSGNLRHPALPATAFAMVSGLAWFWPGNLIMTDTPLFGTLGWPQINTALRWILPASIWFLDFRLLRPSPYLALGGGFILISGMRGVWWDYYFLEIAVLCLLHAGDAQAPAPEDAGDRRTGLSRAAVGFLCAVLAANTAYGYLLRIGTDKQKLAMSAMENLEREGRITVDQMTGAPFGYLGWKLFDYFLANEGRTFGELPDFMGYVRRDRVVVETTLPWRNAFKRELPPQAVLLDSGACSIGFLPARYRVADLRGPDSSASVMGRPMTLDPARFRSPPAPLNDREWTTLLDSLARP